MISARFAMWAIAVAFLSATQDIVIDAYRIEILSETEMPHGTAMNQFGYRTRQSPCRRGHDLPRLAGRRGPRLGRRLWLTAFCVLPAAIGSLIAGPGLFVEKHALPKGRKWAHG